MVKRISFIKAKSAKLSLTLIVFLVSTTMALSQQYYMRQKIYFSLLDDAGQPLTDAAISTGQIKLFSAREAKVSTDPHLSFDKKTNLFEFSESVYSPGISLAFVSDTDTMYVSVYGRSNANRVIDGVKVQRGSYVLTSNEFAPNKHLKVENWKTYLEDGVPAAKQDISPLAENLRDKKPISMVPHSH